MADVNGKQDEDVSVAERAKRAAGLSEEQRQMEAAEPEQPEMFPAGSLAGEGVTLKTLQKPGHSVTTEVALSRAKVPLTGGLLDPNRRARVLVTARPGKVHELPLREDDAAPDKVTGWAITQDLTVQHVQNVPAEDRELVLHLVRSMLDESPQAAGALVDELSAMVAAELAPA